MSVPAQDNANPLDRGLETEPAAAGSRVGRASIRRPLALVLAVIVVFVLWEGVKLLGGTPWRAPGAVPGSGSPVLWDPPFRWPFASDLALPHIWNIVLVMGQPFRRGADQSVIQYLFVSALYTWREAFIGFVLGSLLGLGLATAFVHSRLAERAFVPYVVASQTIPIIALAPLIVFALGQDVLSVVVIATYLTFFPVTIAMLRGLRSFDPRALELLRSYGASKVGIYTKLRLPASMPYFFTALKIAATASIVGAIIAEDTGGISEGLGRVIITFNQYYVTEPEKLWAAIFVAGVLGVAFFLVIRIAEMIVLRGRPGVDA